MNREEIDAWCNKFNIYNFIINDDLTVNVFDDVDLHGRHLKEIPIQFNNVFGKFDCSYNWLSTLKGSPYKCDSFVAVYNKITDLENFPLEVEGEVLIYGNPIESLDGIPLNLKEDNLKIDVIFKKRYIDYKRNIKFNKIKNMINYETRL